MKMDCPDVSIVMTAYNEEKYLPILLESLRWQRTSLTMEAVLVDDHSVDRTREIAKRYGVRCITNDDGLDVVGMRNLGVRRSHGRVILLTDCDCAYSENYVQRMAAPILAENSSVEMTEALWQVPLERKYDVEPDPPYSRSYLLFLRWAPGVLAGVRSPVRLAPWFGIWIRSAFRRSLMSIGDRVRSGMLMVSRDLFDRVGGQTGDLGTGEDVRFTNACLNEARETRWVRGVVHYYSLRRHFPPPGLGWIWHPATNPVTKMFQLSPGKIAAYADPKGKR